jgi:dTDP-4-amino-4,6-dideoxygalactose transaminase
MKRTIAISLSPNVFFKDVVLALKTLFQPWNYNNQTGTQLLEEWFRKFFKVSYVFSYTSGRAGLYEILKGYNIGEKDEVILQAFTCVALPNAIIASGATPIYADIAENLTLDPADLEKKITPKTKAIIMQHTFGIPSAAEKICTIAKKNNIPVIEDCAHGIGITYKGKKLGTFGDVAFFSFGRDKAFSCVFGGMVITNNAVLAKNIQKSYETIPLPSHGWIAQQLFHPVAFSFILAFYDVFSVGKLLLIFLQKLHMLSFPVSQMEKKGVYKRKDVKKLPGGLASLALEQLKRIDSFNRKREHYATMYMEGLKQYTNDFPSKVALPYLRFSILSEKRDTIMMNLRKHHVYLGKWYANVIDPIGTNFSAIGYGKGSCPKAEMVAQRILNLPTMPRMTEEDIQNVIRLIKLYV